MVPFQVSAKALAEKVRNRAAVATIFFVIKFPLGVSLLGTSSTVTGIFAPHIPAARISD